MRQYTSAVSRRRHWWTRLAAGFGFALVLGVPAVALADEATGPTDQDAYQTRDVTPQVYDTWSANGPLCAACGDQNRPPPVEQSRYEPSSTEPTVVASPHPYTQSHYQLGAGHSD